MTTKNEVLSLAAAHIEKGWCKGTFAKTARGEHVLASDPKAIKWCVQGAMGAARAELPEWVYLPISSILYNDTAATKEDVLAYLSEHVE